ncbi:MAG: penicillin-binding protein 2 [Deltaproteobacteria bacterium]|jgi:penicillin-binding protein 2|nr:penicillin-binding protein 2 [Deltaproteobacteria bacterium]
MPIEEAGVGRLAAGVDPSIVNRLIFIAIAIVLTFGVFGVRLFQLQVIEGEDLGNRARRNSVRTVHLEAPRGDILDRFGRELATTRPAFGVQVMPAEMRERELTLAALGSLLDLDPGELSERVGNPRGRRRFQPVRIAVDLPHDSRTRVESHLYALPGVFTDVTPRRYYVGGSLAAHVLGYTGEIQTAQLEKRAFADYRSGDVIGQAGVESRFESVLRGRAGGRNVVVDVAGRVDEVLDEVEATPGGTVVLTIDRDLQRVAEEAFLPDVIGGQEKRGAVVALDPRSGDVLALVSHPTFDPNSFAGGIDSASWKQLTESEGRPIQNRALAGQYPPGSTYKAFVAAAGLEEGAITTEDRVFCPGTFKLGRRTYRCWKRGGHGWVDLHEALKRSCDVFFYQLGLKLGIDRIAFFANGFHLGRKTGIALGGESPGLVPTQAWKERRFSEIWLKGETVSASIGQGYNLTTPLQLAVAYAAIANGGAILKPRILLRQTGPDGEVEQGPEPELLGKVPVSPEHLATITRALEAVVHETGGTGGRARVDGVRTAGKTGTAQVVRLKETEDLEEEEIPFKFRDHGWFAAFAPVEAPEIVVVAISEHGGHGGSAAGPIVQAVLARYFKTSMPEEPPRQANPPQPLSPPDAPEEVAQIVRD